VEEGIVEGRDVSGRRRKRRRRGKWVEGEERLAGEK